MDRRIMTKSPAFKFVDFKKNDQGEINTLKNLENREILFKYFKDYNDPYESHIGVVAKWPCPYREQDKLRSLISRLDPENLNSNTASRSSMIDFINDNQHLSSFTVDRINDLTKKFRISSFTRRWNHILMWAHYADGCRGAALVFDQSLLMSSGSCRLISSDDAIEIDDQYLHWVRYVHKPPVVDSLKFLEAARVGSEELTQRVASETVEAYALSKYRSWRYEQEVRMLLFSKCEIETKPLLYKYNEKALTAVIMGSLTPVDIIEWISRSVPPQVKINLTRPAPPRYKVEIIQTFDAGDIASGKVKIGQVVG